MLIFHPIIPDRETSPHTHTHSKNAKVYDVVIHKAMRPDAVGFHVDENSSSRRGGRRDSRVASRRRGRQRRRLRRAVEEYVVVG